MAKHYQIQIKKVDDDKFLIYCNLHLEFLIRGCYSFYATMVEQLAIYNQEQYEERKEFVDLIRKLIGGNEIAEVSRQELKWLSEWIDVIMNTVLEIDTANFKEKNMKRFLKTAENFMTEIKSLEIEKEEIKNDN